MKKIISLFRNQDFNKSYSQCGEDIIIEFIFKNLLKIRNPTFMDIGANHPKKFNNTYIFYRSGSRGINIDPNIDSIKLFKKYRSKDINLNLGIGKEKTVKTLYIFENSMLNTFDENTAKIQGGIISKKEIVICHISEIVNKYFNFNFPDFLTLDAEGMDLEILQSINFNNSNFNIPKLICVETIQKTGNSTWVKDFELIDFVKQMGYIHHSDTFINSIFIHPHFLKVKID